MSLRFLEINNIISIILQVIQQHWLKNIHFQNYTLQNYSNKISNILLQRYKYLLIILFELF